MSEPYKFKGGQGMMERGQSVYGSKKTNMCNCPVCEGGSKLMLYQCKNCKGTGQVENAKEECDHCTGTGSLNGKKCPQCQGTGNKNSKDNAKLECMECGKTFTKSNPTADSKCPGCGGSDLELANGKANGKDIDPQKLAEMVVDEIPASQMTES